MCHVLFYRTVNLSAWNWAMLIGESLPSSFPSSRFKSTSTGSAASVCCERLFARLCAAGRAPSRWTTVEVRPCISRRVTPSSRLDERLANASLQITLVMLLLLHCLFSRGREVVHESFRKFGAGAFLWGEGLGWFIQGRTAQSWKMLWLCSGLVMCEKLKWISFGGIFWQTDIFALPLTSLCFTQRKFCYCESLFFFLNLLLLHTLTLTHANTHTHIYWGLFRDITDLH